jgi:hypothetical protein
VVREADRSSEERLSVLDRQQADTDALPPHLLAAPARPWAERVDQRTVRLALVADDRRIWVGRGVADEIFRFFFDFHGVSIWGGPRSVLISHGAAVGSSSNAYGSFVHGIVPDPVTAVRVGEIEAILANNAFIAAASSRDGPIVLATRNGEHVVPLETPPWH